MQPASAFLTASALALVGMAPLAASAAADEQSAAEACRVLALEQGYDNVEVRTIEDGGDDRFDVVLRGEEPDDSDNRSDIACTYDAAIGDVRLDAPAAPGGALPKNAAGEIDGAALAACTEALADAGHDDAVQENRWVREDGGRTIRYTVDDPEGDDLRCLFAPATGDTTLYFKDEGAPPIDVEGAAQAACWAWADGRNHHPADMGIPAENPDGTWNVAFALDDREDEQLVCRFDPKTGGTGPAG